MHSDALCRIKLGYSIVVYLVGERRIWDNRKCYLFIKNWVDAETGSHV